MRGTKCATCHRRDGQVGTAETWLRVEARRAAAAIQARGSLTERQQQRLAEARAAVQTAKNNLTWHLEHDCE